MRIRRPFAQVALLAILLATLAGCLGGPSKSPQLYLLTARAHPMDMNLPTRIGVGPVRVAPFLKRAQIITHGGGGDITIADHHRWSEPLEAGIQRVLSQNLDALTGAEIRHFPWTQNTQPAYALRIDVIDMDRADGDAVLEVSWVLEDIVQAKVLESHRERLTTPINGGESTYAALTTAYSELLAQLAQQMAQGIEKQLRTE